MNVPRTLELRNNGIVDSLTGAMAPELFYENLRREIAAANRVMHSLSIVSVVVVPRNEGAHVEDQALFAERIIKVSSRISQGTRADEYSSRISENGFWVLIRGSRENASTAVERINLDPDIEIDVIERMPGESFQSWILRVDQVHFRS